jgi:hypothetical protein
MISSKDRMKKNLLNLLRQYNPVWNLRAFDSPAGFKSKAVIFNERSLKLL